MYPSDIRKKLATGKPVLSTSMPSFEPHIANATYNCKPDWVWIDTCLLYTSPSPRDRG